MPELTPTILSHFALFRFTESYWQLDAQERGEFQQNWLSGLRQATDGLDIYQVFPTAADDILIWSTVSVEETCDTSRLFERYARATNPHRHLISPSTVLWGYSRPSEYSRAKSSRAIDPLSQTRKPYLVIYPFTKTTGWYLMSAEARQGMMNEHIRIGKQHTEIDQMLLYSFGVQDQEFVVVYEMEDLSAFSNLVRELRSTEARRFTQQDTPLHTAIYHPAEETLALF